MALAAPFDTKFGIITAYWMVASYRVDRIARSVTVQVAVFKDADTRAAHKAASAAAVEAMAKIVELSKTAEMEKQRGIAGANLWGDVQEIAIPEGAVPIAADGTIELKAVYAHLADKVVKGAEAA
jgi:hypothetical protein